MSWIAALLLLVSAIATGIDAWKTKSVISFALTLIALALIFQFAPGTSHHFHF